MVPRNSQFPVWIVCGASFSAAGSRRAPRTAPSAWTVRGKRPQPKFRWFLKFGRDPQDRSRYDNYC